jgi:hypothetical protein
MHPPITSRPQVISALASVVSRPATSGFASLHPARSDTSHHIEFLSITYVSCSFLRGYCVITHHGD